MARTLNLTDGTTTISLISTSGIIPTRMVDGVKMTEDQLFGEERYAAETLRLNLRGTSVDNVATQKQALVALLRKAVAFWKNGRSAAPVYLTQQLTGETNARYAIVRSVPILEEPATLRVPLELDFIIENFGLTIIRENPWSSRVPGVMPANPVTLTPTQGPTGETTCFVANNVDTLTATFVGLFNYDASGPTWSGDLKATAAVTIWSISGSTPAAGDMIYAGGYFSTLIVPIGTAGVFTSNIVVEYSKGGGVWGTLTLGADPGYVLYPTGPEDGMFKSTGQWGIFIKPPTDWAEDTVQTLTALWIRLRLDSVTAWTTTPVTSSKFYPQKFDYIDLPSTAITGDGRPLIDLKMYAGSGGGSSPSYATPSRILVGARSTRNGDGLTNFRCAFPLGSDAPTSWALTAGTDTTLSTDKLNSPNGHVAHCDFAGDASMQTRVTLSGTGMLRYFEGTFKVLLLAEQTAGADGDCYVKAGVMIGGTTSGYPVVFLPAATTYQLKGHDTGPEWIDLGELHLPFTPAMPNDSLAADIHFLIQASRASGASALDFHMLKLLPTDEFALDYHDPLSDTTSGGSALRGDSLLEADAGIMTYRIIKKIISGGNEIPIETWLGSGDMHKLEPNKQYRFYFVIMNYPTAWGDGYLVGCKGLALAVKLYAANGYSVLRGAT